MNRRILNVILPLAVGLLTACNNAHKTLDEAQPVKTATAIASDGARTVIYPGRTLSPSEVNVAFRVAGPIERVLVKRGDRVSKGQLIAELDPRDYEVQLAATEAEYAQAEAETRRIAALYEEQATTASNYDKARFGLQQLAEKLQNHRNQLADTRLTAPVSGYVRERLHEPGETVSAGMGVVALAADGAGVEVEIHLPATAYRHIGHLTSATALIEGLENPLPLTLISVAQGANASQLYTIRFAAGSAQGLTAGLSASVALTFTEGDDDAHLVSVPSTAVFSQEGQCYVFVVNGGKALRRQVHVEALHTDGNMDIQGIGAGDTVVSAGVHHLTDGQAVEPISEPSADNVGGLI